MDSRFRGNDKGLVIPAGVYTPAAPRADRGTGMTIKVEVDDQDVQGRWPCVFGRSAAVTAPVTVFKTAPTAPRTRPGE
jgi:hypothetical protein